MAKEKPTAAKSSSNTKTWLIAAVAVVVVVLLIVWAKRGVQTSPAPEPTAPETVPAGEAPIAPGTEPAATGTETTAPAEGTEGETRVLGQPGNAEIVKRAITWESAGGQPVSKETDVSMFDSISCQHAQRDETDRSTVKEDAISFTLTNKGKKAYHLYYVKYGTGGYDDAMIVTANGRRVRDVEKACGQMDIAAGETVTCSGAAALLRTGQTYTGKQQVNTLQATSPEFIDQTVFTC